jgi:exosome complex exonuclease DIS3/RRP44
MLTSKTFVKKTKRGRILKVVREHYLREDVYCGVKDCSHCLPPSNVSSLDTVPDTNSTIAYLPHFILPDTNICLHQMDILEDPAISNVILAQVVLQEVKHHNLGVYKRIRDVMSNPSKKFYVFSNEHHKDTYIERREEESPNDRNDRAIRVCVKWYNEHLKSCIKVPQPPYVVMLTNDNVNKQKATALGIECYTISEYVMSLSSSPHLIDLLAQLDDRVLPEASNKKVYFPEHLPLSVIQKGLKTGKYYQGSYHGSRDNYLEGFVNVHSFDQWILVQGVENMNRAVHDDIVAVELFDKSKWIRPLGIITNEIDAEHKDDNKLISKDHTVDDTSVIRPTGMVVGIIKRNWRQYCGVLRPSVDVNAFTHTFIPADRRVPYIRFETRQSVSLQNKRIIISIDSWPRSSRYPKGHFVKEIGLIGDKETESEVILVEHDIPHHPFSAAVLNDLPPSNWTIPIEESKKRCDLRHLPVCSVDPPGCTDIDDALHFVHLDNGNFQVGVHIADVSFFIRHGTALDEEATNRGTTVYLANKRIDMIPDVLSSNLCSLVGGQDRLAFSCLWELSPNADIVSTTFTKSVIRSRKSFTYAEAQMVIDDCSCCDDVALGLRGLNDLAKLLKANRIAAGALSLASMEVRFEIDSETHDPINLQTKELQDANSLVEEFMLLANISVAKHIYEYYPECALLRRHPSPPLSNFDILVKAAGVKGFVLSFDSAKSLADSLNNADIPGEPHFNMMLRILATRCMMQALYFCSGTLPYEQFHHYGLATDIYTHFTSPIRRYSDIIVHRLLAASINADVTYPSLLNKQQTQQLTNHLNFRHKMAQNSQRSSVMLYAHLYFKDKELTEDGFVLSVHRNALKVLVPKYGIEGNLFFDKMPDKVMPTLSYDESIPRLSVNGVHFSLFDRVIVKVFIENRNQQTKLSFHLIDPVLPNLQESVQQENEETSPPLKRKKLL